MIEWIPSNPQLLGFIEDHLLFLTLVYWIFQAMFPDSKLLRAIGEAFSRIRMPKGPNK